MTPTDKDAEIVRLRKQYDDLCERTLTEYQAMRDVVDALKMWNGKFPAYVEEALARLEKP